MPNIGERRIYVLNVLVYRTADYIINSASGSAATPFVSARFNGNVISTEAQDPNLPWNRRLELPFSMPLRSDSIEIQLWEKKSVSYCCLTFALFLFMQVTFDELLVCFHSFAIIVVRAFRHMRSGLA